MAAAKAQVERLEAEAKAANERLAAEAEAAAAAEAEAARVAAPKRPDLFLYGAPGAGKSYLGAKLRDDFGYRFEEGDAWLTADMRASLERGESFTPAQRERFSEVVAERVGAALAEERGARPVVVAQAMFKRAHRRAVAAACPGLVFARVACDEAERSRRLEARGTLVGADLGGRMALDLENDDADATVRSDGDAAAALAELLWAARPAAA